MTAPDWNDAIAHLFNQVRREDGRNAADVRRPRVWRQQGDNFVHAADNRAWMGEEELRAGGDTCAPNCTGAPAADTLRLGFVAQGGAGGYNSDRSYTASWTSTSVLGADNFTLALGRTTNVAGTPFAFFDNVSLDVDVVPEPGCALLGSFGLLALLRRRRA